MPTVGFVNAGSGAGGGHFEHFLTLLPQDVRLEFGGIDVLDASTDDFDIRYDLHGDLDPLLERTARLAADKGWDGVIVAAAPLEVMNPGLQERLNATLRVPVTTALNACTAALRAFSAGRILLMTPFTDRMNQRIKAYLAEHRIEARTVGDFDRVAEAMILTPEQVKERTRAALAQTQGVDAIYFQGAVLDPVKVLDPIEQEAELPVVASNPAMLWYILSRLGRRYSIPGHGRLLRDWPAIA
jgi:maleate cis-trans isomerase